jgi:hypothetical protein
MRRTHNIERIAREAARYTSGDRRDDTVIIVGAIRRALRRDTLSCERLEAELDYLLERLRGWARTARISVPDRVRLEQCILQRDDVSHSGDRGGLPAPPDKDGGPMWHNLVRAYETCGEPRR